MEDCVTVCLAAESAEIYPPVLFRVCRPYFRSSRVLLTVLGAETQPCTCGNPFLLHGPIYCKSR